LIPRPSLEEAEAGFVCQFNFVVELVRNHLVQPESGIRLR